MTIQYRLNPIAGLAPFGIFHNLDCPGEDTGYIHLHIIGRFFAISWKR